MGKGLAYTLVIGVVAALVIGLVGGYIIGYYMKRGQEIDIRSVCPGYGILSKIKSRGALVVGTSADWPPYEYITPTGEFAGIDIEIAKRVAKYLNVSLQIKDMKFAALFEAVKRGDVDIAIADIAMKPERLQVVDFSIPYRCEEGKAIIIKKGFEYSGYESLYGKRIGVQLGTTEEDLAKQFFGGKSEIVAFDRVYPEMTLALKTGKIDAMITAPDVAKIIVSKERDLQIVDYLPFFSCSVIVMPHCAYDLKVEVSKVIWSMLQSGELDKIKEQEIRKWMELAGAS
jgi:polar amino acid transport system substrate-binding protein